MKLFQAQKTQLQQEGFKRLSPFRKTYVKDNTLHIIKDVNILTNEYDKDFLSINKERYSYIKPYLTTGTIKVSVNLYRGKEFIESYTVQVCEITPNYESHRVINHNYKENSIYRFKLSTKKRDESVNNTNYTPNQTLSVGTAFSGIGAPEQGLKNLGIENNKNIFMCEIDKFSRQTYTMNHKVDNIFPDITKMNMKKTPYVDLFVWGSPCQSFSIQGKRGGLNDTRGTLVFYGLEYIRCQRPKYFVYENVKGLKNHDKGRTFETIMNSFNELGYKIQYSVINSKFYVPQNRERLFIVGIRKDIDKEFTFPKESKVTTTLNDVISSNKKDIRGYEFDTTGMVPYIQSQKTDIKTTYKFPKMKYESDSRVSSSDGISPCITTGGKIKIHDTKNNVFRYLTEDELTKIQGFPEDFQFPVSKSQQRKQLGNSISVPVLESIFRELLPEYINNYQKVETQYQMAA